MKNESVIYFTRMFPTVPDGTTNRHECRFSWAPRASKNLTFTPLQTKLKNIPVIGIAGKVPLTTDAQLQKYFDVLLAINNEPFEITTAIQYTKDNLVRTAKAIGDLLAMQKDAK